MKKLKNAMLSDFFVMIKFADAFSYYKKACYRCLS